jgi:serine/threonine protein phosphatase PrpC
MISLRSTQRRSATERHRLPIVRLVPLGLVVVLALAFGFVAATLTPRVDPAGTPPAFVGALGTGLIMVFWTQSRRLATGRWSIRLRPDRSTVVEQDSGANNPEQPGGQRGPTADPTPGRGEPLPPHPPPIKPARRVELAALTTSGVSGLTVDRGSSGPFDVYAATQVGFQHAKDGHTREDAYAIGGAPDIGWVFLAVADGLGSAENSHAAAQLASQTAVKLLRQHVRDVDPGRRESDWMALAPKIAAKIAEALDPSSVEERARQLSYEPGASHDAKRSPAACTLIFAGLGPVSDKGYPLLWGCVGDTELILVDLDSGQPNWLTHNPSKQAGGMISNVTFALPRDYEHVTKGYKDLRPNTMIVLASDGMADAIRQEPAQYAELLPQVAGGSPKEWMFGELVGFDLPGLHDDRTMVAAWPRRTPGKTR